MVVICSISTYNKYIQIKIDDKKSLLRYIMLIIPISIKTTVA